MTAFVYQLTLDQDARQSPEACDNSVLLNSESMVRSIKWYCRLRFLVAAILYLIGLIGLFGYGYFKDLGLALPQRWPIGTATILCLLNLGFAWSIQRTAKEPSNHWIRINLGIHIILDLVIMTVIVHFLGSTTTFASFAYLFHIVLACTFFPKRTSLCITICACGFFLGCVTAEQWGWLASSSIFISSTLPSGKAVPMLAMTLHVGSALVVWMTAWYLLSRQTSVARQRDTVLAAINQQLVEAGRERSAHMLRTTHEIKAPFAAIHANTQILLKGHCGELPEKARNIVERIEKRCRRLSEEIKQMLQLANLRSRGQETPITTSIDLCDCLTQCLSAAKDITLERDAVIETDLQPVSVPGIKDHLRMMFENIISNAIAYSHQGGTVRVACAPNGPDGAEVSIADEGIGIPEEKVPKIFQDYYRSQEAVKHNKSSTGLGLAVVRKIAQKHHLRIQVETELGHGTLFRIEFPQREITNALSH